MNHAHDLVLARKLASLHPLPSPRGTALRILRLSAIEDVSSAEVARVAQTDPVLAGKLISAANGNARDGRPRIGSIASAVFRLGFRATRQIALGFSLAGNYGRGPCKHFDYQDFWTGSVLRALAARAIAEQTGTGDPQEALACGLLAEIGRLAFATIQPDAYAELLSTHGQRGAPLREAEKAQFSIDHGALGCALLEDWAIPDDLVCGIEGYFSPPLNVNGPGRSARRLSMVLALAETIARTASAPSSEREAWTHLVLERASSLEIDASDLDEISREIEAQMPVWAQLLELSAPALCFPSFPDYEDGRPAADARPEESADGLRILVVDDDESARLLAQMTLERAGHQITLAEDGRDALASILAATPQLVITDVSMPHMDGLALCRRLRESEIGRDLPIIALTSREQVADLVECIDAGANDFVSKIAPPEVLLTRVRAAGRAIRGSDRLRAELKEARGIATALAFDRQRASSPH